MPRVRKHVAVHPSVQSLCSSNLPRNDGQDLTARTMMLLRTPVPPFPHPTQATYQEMLGSLRALADQLLPVASVWLHLLLSSVRCVRIGELEVWLVDALREAKPPSSAHQRLSPPSLPPSLYRWLPTRVCQECGFVSAVSETHWSGCAFVSLQLPLTRMNTRRPALLHLNAHKRA